MSGLVRKLPGVNRQRRPLYRSTILDDALFGQPLNALVRFERFRSLRSSPSSQRGSIAVVIVNYNTKDVLATTLDAVRAMSPAETSVIVIDNASTDGSREFLRSKAEELDIVLLPTNIGHGRALDIGVFRSRAEFIVTLDSDAFPYSSDWLDRLTTPLGPNILAVGWRGRRDRLHPCCAVYRRDALIRLGLSFANFNLGLDEPGVFGHTTWDTGELISEAIGSDRFELIDNWSTEFGGMVMGDVLYHHCGVTTLITEEDDHRAGIGHEAQWDRAVKAYLGPEPRPNTGSAQI